MSGRLPVPSVPLSPSASREAQLADMQEQLRGKANRGVEETFSTILLRAPGGGYFRLAVSDAGVLSTSPVVRS